MQNHLHLRRDPPIPVSAQELGGRISERNCDLRNALELDTSTVVQIGSLLRQGISQFVSVSRDPEMGSPVLR